MTETTTTEEALLTDREQQIVLSYGSLGSINAVADEHGLSPNTVRNHLYNARVKLGVRFTVEAVWMVRSMGNA